MTVSPSSVRDELFAGCTPLFTDMLELVRARFGERTAYIHSTVGEYEVAIRGAGRSGRHGHGGCPACGTPITRLRPTLGCKEFQDHWGILCGDERQAVRWGLR